MNISGTFVRVGLGGGCEATVDKLDIRVHVHAGIGEEGLGLADCFYMK